jgi:CNT family concentrative nucleoside transporter
MRFQALLGIFVFLGIAWVFSEKRKAVRTSTIVTGVLVQFIVAGLLLYVPIFKELFQKLNEVVLALEAATKDGPIPAQISFSPFRLCRWC